MADMPEGMPARCARRVARPLPFAFCLAIGLVSLAPPAAGQGKPRESLAGEKAAQAAKAAEIPAGFNLQYGPVAFSVQPSLHLEFNDNIYRSTRDRRDDLILEPQVRFGGFWPITQMNSLTFALGVGYQQYVKNTGINSGIPLISPDSELLFNLFTGNFHFQFRERFSYQESLSLGYGYANQAGQFINLNNIARLERFNNLAGVDMDWDLNKLIVSASYDHENFIASGPQYDYLTRASELLGASATFLVAPNIKPGLETKDSLNLYDKPRLPDHWRASLGPFIEIALSPHLSFRTGAGYQTVEPLKSAANAQGMDTWYAYGQIKHQVNRFFRHDLGAGREHQVGWNAMDVQNTYIRYRVVWDLIQNLNLSTQVSANYSEETGGVFQEIYDEYQAGLALGFQLTKRWRATLAYSVLIKDSDLALRNYCQNRVIMGASYRF